MRNKPSSCYRQQTGNLRWVSLKRRGLIQIWMVEPRFHICFHSVIMSEFLTSPSPLWSTYRQLWVCSFKNPRFLHIRTGTILITAIIMRWVYSLTVHASLTLFVGQSSCLASSIDGFMAASFLSLILSFHCQGVNTDNFCPTCSDVEGIYEDSESTSSCRLNYVYIFTLIVESYQLFNNWRKLNL